MPYPTLTEDLKLQLSPGLVASYDIQPGNRVSLFWDKHTHVGRKKYHFKNVLNVKITTFSNPE